MLIGEYVHYHYTNYLNYGLDHAKDGEGRKANPAEALQAQKKQLLRTLNDRKRKEKIVIKQDLENKLNFFFPKNGSYINFGFTREQAEVLQNLIRRIFEQSVDTKGVNINYDTLGVYSGKSSVSLNNKKYMNIQREGQKYTNFGAIKRRIDSINALRTQLNALISTNAYKPADKIMLDRINRISKEMEEFEKDYSDSKAGKR